MGITEFYLLIRSQSEINLKELIDFSGAKIEVNFVNPRDHLWQVYDNRLGLPPYDYSTLEGMIEVVEKLKTSRLTEIRLTVLDFEDGSISLFTSPNYSDLLGYIIYPPS